MAFRRMHADHVVRPSKKKKTIYSLHPSGWINGALFSSFFSFLFLSFFFFYNSPVDEVNRKILQHAKDANTKVGHG